MDTFEEYIFHLSCEDKLFCDCGPIPNLCLAKVRIRGGVKIPNKVQQILHKLFETYKAL